VLRSLGVDPDAVLAGQAESPEDRSRVFEDLTQAVLAVAARRGLVVVLDDIHWGDEPSLLVLRHLADQLAGARLLVLVAFRDLEPASVLPRVLPDLLRAPVAERIDLRGFELAEVREQLARMTADEAPADARAVLDVTGGNPLFVREVARAMADGSWRPDRPPRTVLEVVGARLDRVSDGCRRLVQAAAILGRDAPLALVAATLDQPVDRGLPLVDEAIAHGLLDRVGDAGDYRSCTPSPATRSRRRSPPPTGPGSTAPPPLRRPRPTSPATSASTSARSPGTGWRWRRTGRRPPPAAGRSAPPRRPLATSPMRRASGCTGPRWRSTGRRCPRPIAASSWSPSAGPPTWAATCETAPTRRSRPRTPPAPPGARRCWARRRWSWRRPPTPASTP
jgi:hypothetical protein